MRVHERTLKTLDPIQAWLETRTQAERDILTKTPAAFAVDAARIQHRRAKHPGDFIDLGPPEEGSVERAETAAIAMAEGGLSAFRTGALRAWARGERTPWTLGHEALPGIHAFLPPSFMRETEGSPLTAILIRGPRDGLLPSEAEKHRRRFDVYGFRGASPAEVAHILASARHLPRRAKVMSVHWNHSHPGRRAGGAPKAAITRSLVHNGNVTPLSSLQRTHRRRYGKLEGPAGGMNLEDIDDRWMRTTSNSYLLEIIERVELP